MIFWRIQPKGLEIKNWYSETSERNIADGLHVFANWCEIDNMLLYPAENAESYGDELLVIEVDYFWDNGDCEGVCINPNKAKILKRISMKRLYEIKRKLKD